ELSLKAVILICGGRSKDCKKAGHDLQTALTKAQSLGYKSNIPYLENLVEDLNITHNSYYFRYMTPNDTEVPGDSARAIEMVRALIHAALSRTSVNGGNPNS